MNTNSILSSVNTINQTSSSFSKTSNVDKAKSDDFENYIASKKIQHKVIAIQKLKIKQK